MEKKLSIIPLAAPRIGPDHAKSLHNPAGPRISGWLKRPLLHVLIVAALGLLVYSNTFNAPFVFDDGMYIVNNPTVQDFGYFIDTSRAEGLSIEEPVRRYLRTRYVIYLSFWANYRIGGLGVWGYHAVNFSVHIINALLVYVLVILTFRTPYLMNSGLSGKSRLMALFSSLLFVAHPLGTEVVTYVTQRFVLFSAMFYLLCIVSYIGSRLSGRRAAGYGLFALSVLSAVLAMKSKENAFTLPLAVGLYEFMFFRSSLRNRALLLAPVLLTMLIIPVSYLSEQGPGVGLLDSVGEATRLQTDMPRLDYLSAQFRVIVTYVRLLFLPINQNLDYDYPVYVSFLSSEVLLSLFLLSLIMGLGVYWFRRGRGRVEFKAASFGVFWLFLTLSVESSILPISEMMFEYRMYLPSVGAIVGVVVLMFMFSGARAEKRLWAPITVLALLSAVIMSFSALAYARNMLWQDKIILWEDTAAKSPGKARPHYNLGVAYADYGRYEEAVGEYQTAIGIDPEHYDALNNLGIAYFNLGRYEDAVKEYQAALRIDPEYIVANYNLAVVYDVLGRSKEAMRQYDTTTGVEPGYAKAYNDLGVLYEKEGRYEEAIKQYRAAIMIEPGFVDARNNLGIVYARRGRFEEAEGEYKEAIRTDPEYAEAHINLGTLYAGQERYDEAEGEYKEAIRIDPGFAEAHYKLATLHDKRGRYEEAVEEYLAALGIEPAHARAHSNLGIIYAKRGRYEEAVREFQGAIEAEPESEEFRSNLGIAMEMMEKQRER
jgi:tetratricopeptide (TPR) repeat protein